VLKTNIIANYAGAALVGLINVCALAVYTRLYGAAGWGNIATFVAIVNTLMMVDFGISQIYVAGFARAGDPARLFNVYRACLGLIAVIAASVVLLGVAGLNAAGVLAKPVYARHGLLLLAMLLFVLNFANNFYYVDLGARQQQLQQNLRWTAFTLMKNTGAITLAYMLPERQEGYFAAFLLVAAVELAFNARRSHYGRVKISMPDILAVLKEGRLLSLSIVVGVLVFNLDRIFLPTVTDASDFGVYATVATVGLYYLQLQYPIMKAFFPHVASQTHAKSGNTVRVSQQVLVVAGLMGPPLAISAYFSSDILRAFSVDAGHMAAAETLFRSLLLAVFLNAVYHVAYQRLVIHQRAQAILAINLTGLLLAGAVLLTLGAHNPFQAGAVYWVGGALIQLVSGWTYYAFKKNDWQ
jgi:O-antigen/teichoic acid export membrane protein